MKRWMVLCLLLIGTRAGADSNPSSASGQSWASVEKTLGRSGEVQGEGLQILFPRTDLNVVVQGYPLDSANILVSRFTFTLGPAGTSKKDRLEGQIYLLDSEVSPAMAQAAKGGLEITALYSPFLDESPSLKCLRLKGEGSRSSLAFSAKMILSVTGTPMALPTPNPTPLSSPTAPVVPSHANPWGGIQDLLGPGEEKGPTLLYSWEGKERTASLSFQNHGKETTAVGEFGVPEGESKALVEELLQRHIAVTAVFTGSLDGVDQDFVDFWAVGDQKKLAEDLKEIMDQEELLNP